MFKEFDAMLANMERTRRERNQADEETLIRRMKDECNQALARQWKLAHEQMTLVKKETVFSNLFPSSLQAVKQAEEQLSQLLELKYRADKERYAQELSAQKEVRCSARLDHRTLFARIRIGGVQ